MKITPVRYGETVLPESWIFRDGDPARRRPISLTVFLIETPGRKILVDAGCDTMPGFDLTWHEPPPLALKKQTGLSADEITDVIITHAHHDHIEALRHFKNAAVWLQVLEFEQGRKHVPAEMKVNLFEEECTVAEGVRVVRWGGHCPGSSVVEIGKTVIVGDECYSAECIEKQIPTGASKNPEQSEKFIQNYRDGWKILTCHDL